MSSDDIGGTGGRISSTTISKINESVKNTNSSLEPITAPPKGTRDFYPDDHRLKQWMFNKWRYIAELYNFEEYDAPVLEHEELYIRKAGEEITQQLYNFEDKGGRRLSLRPEMTPSLARMILAKGKSLSYPIKWFAIPQCWRYERMTKGRRREHYQWNMDVWGVSGVEAEAELLSAIVASFRSMGLTAKDVGIKINSRKILNSLMNLVGVTEDKWVATCVLVDKLEKVPVSALKGELVELDLTEEAVTKLLDSLKIKNIDDFSAILGEESCDGVRDIQRLMQLLSSYGVSDWVQFDASVVRGLAYYTGIVFEGFDRDGELRAICGGGRYDNLLSSMGGDSVPAVGFGFGDAVIVELLKARGLLPELDGINLDAVDSIVYPMDDNLRVKAVEIASTMRDRGLRVDLIMDQRKPKWVFQRADKNNAPLVIMLAEKEHSNGEVMLRKMRTREQSPVKYESIADEALSYLKSV